MAPTFLYFVHFSSKTVVTLSWHSDTEESRLISSLVTTEDLLVILKTMRQKRKALHENCCKENFKTRSRASAPETGPAWEGLVFYLFGSFVKQLKFRSRIDPTQYSTQWSSAAESQRFRFREIMKYKIPSGGKWRNHDRKYFGLLNNTEIVTRRRILLRISSYVLGTDYAWKTGSWNSYITKSQGFVTARV